MEKEELKTYMYVIALIEIVMLLLIIIVILGTVVKVNKISEKLGIDKEEPNTEKK